MFDPSQYQLIDFGEGRKLERFGECVLDRPCPAADGSRKSDPEAWKLATARFHRRDDQQGHWTPRRALPERWTVVHDALRFELKPTSFGHVGLFAEQAENWDWIADRIRRASRPKVLNLFAYTGGSTLAAASAGAEVVHVDSARNVVQWARRNAERSGLIAAPIRWIVEDAARFARRELKRGNSYDAVILDPPSYGHGPKGEAWKLTRHLPDLLSDCRELTRGRRLFLLVTCHSPGFGPADLEALVADLVFGHCGAGCMGWPLSLSDARGRALPSGVCVRAAPAAMNST